MSKSIHNNSYKFIDGGWRRKMRHESRRISKKIIREELENQEETPKELGLKNSKSEMMDLIYNKGESVIPWGDYCYDKKVCPYWDIAKNKESGEGGFCWFLGKGDWWEDGSIFLLWDQLKNCSVRDYLPENSLPLIDEKNF